MTREEAKEELIQSLTENHIPDPEAVEMAIKALEQEHCEDANANQHNSNALNDVGQHTNALEGDVISRQAVLDRIRESIETYHNQYTTDMLNMWGLFTQFIKEMPSVTPQPKTGHWIDKFGGCECSECGYSEPGYSDYCPNCGARMVDPQESEGRAIEIQNILTQLHKEYRDTENGAAGEDVRWWNAGIRRAIEIVERSDKE